MSNKEKSSCVLSDDTAVDFLKKSSINIARRTVAKYCESRNITSIGAATQRKARNG